MTQGNYISEDTMSLVRRAEKILGNMPVLDLTNWTNPMYLPMGTTQIRSLNPSCHSIIVKNTITVTESSIVMCSSGGLPDMVKCPIPSSCPTGPLSPVDYVNMVATIDALAAQTGVEITFKYILDGVPTNTTITVDLSAGTNTVYAFDPSIQYPSGTTLVLYGAEVTKS